MSESLIAVVADGPKGRAYIAPSKLQIDAASRAAPIWRPDLEFEPAALGFRVGNYGMKNFGDLFTNRQIAGLEAFVETIKSLEALVYRDAIASGLGNDDSTLAVGGHGARAYSQAIAVYLSFLVGQLANHGSTICGWNSTNEQMRSTFSRQALSMTWDFAECNFFSESSGSFESLFTRMVKGFETLSTSNAPGVVMQHDAQSVAYSMDMVISTDPPYYDNIGYADLSDFFYSWMRPLLREIYPSVFSSLMTPKAEELVATPVRHGGRAAAEEFFLQGMIRTIQGMSEKTTDKIPATIYYAFKQSEIEQEGISSTGWATFLQAIFESGYSLVGTWPMRTEKPGRMRAVGSNALANSVVLVCRKKEATAEVITRAEFIRALKRELPPAIADLQSANIAPADMPQSAIGPGMGVFSRYRAVLESDDSPMSVKTALQLINRELDDYLGGIQGEFDADSRFAITWFEQNGMAKGDYGTANNIAQARGISVESVKHAGIVESAAGKGDVPGVVANGWVPDHWTLRRSAELIKSAVVGDGVGLAGHVACQQGRT